MATVYKAEHIHFKENRALKVINSDLAADESFVKRFIQEAITTRRLQHPNAVRVDDIEKAEDGRPFMVMELINGVQLKEAMADGPMQLGVALLATRQIAAALDAAHALGMVHRDIKPSNIVLQHVSTGLSVKVLDFGVAKIKESHLEDHRVPYMTLTGTGVVIGTPAYMSPEQATGQRGAEIDGRADIYSLGVVTYQMLTGRLPYDADSELELMLAHIKMPPTSIHHLRPDLPKPLCDLVMSCLSKDRNVRPQNCCDLIKRLDAFGDLAKLQQSEGTTTAVYNDGEATIDNPQSGGQPEPKPKGVNKQWYGLTKQGIFTALAVGLLIALGLAAGWIFGFRRRPIEQAKAKFPAVPPNQQIEPARKNQSPTPQFAPQPQSQKPDDGIGRLFLQTKVAKALVQVDGKFSALTDDAGDALLVAPRGSHKISLTKSGFDGLEIRRVFHVGAMEHLTVQLSPQVEITPVQATSRLIPPSTQNAGDEAKRSNVANPISFADTPKTGVILNETSKSPIGEQPTSLIHSEVQPARNPPVKESAQVATADSSIKSQSRVPPEAAKAVVSHVIRTFKPGQMAKVQGVILSRQGDLWKLRIDDDSIGTLILSHATKIVLKSGVVFRHTTKMESGALVPGLHIEAQGRGNDKGELAADRVSFDPNSMRASRQIDQRVPGEGAAVEKK